MDTKKMPTGVQLLPDGRYRVRAALRDPQTGKTLQRELTLETGASEREAVQAVAGDDPRAGARLECLCGWRGRGVGGDSQGGGLPRC
jgi:hypothetical protein